MKTLFKTFGIVTVIITVVLGASLLGSKNGVNIHNSGKNYAITSNVSTESDNSVDVQTLANDYSTVNLLESSNKPIEAESKSSEINNTENQNDSTTPVASTSNSELPFISNIDELVALFNLNSEKLEEKFTAKLSPSLDMNTLLDDIPEDEIRHLTSVAYSAKIKGNEVTATFNVEYKDHFTVLRAFKDPSLVSKLTGNEKDLLKKSEQIISELIKDSMTDGEKEKAIHDYLVTNFRYDNQVNTGNFSDLSYSGYGLLFNGVGVCDAYARIMYILSNMAGVECMYVIGYAGDENENYGHAWNKIKIDDAWYNLDVTWNDPLPDVPGRILYDYYNVTDEFISKDHSWNRDFYPVANTKSK